MDERNRQLNTGWPHLFAGKFRRGVLAAGLVLLFVRFFAVATYSNTETEVRAYNVWNVFHYYLGAKYYPEIGHFDLYTCALEADQESMGRWNSLLGARDMHTYLPVLRSGLPPCPRENFTPARWNEFSGDVAAFSQLAGPQYFAGLLLDKGFNPPPSWVALACPLASAIPLAAVRLCTIVFNLDVAAVLLGLLLVWRFHDGAMALLTAGLVVFFFGNYGCIGGNFLQYLWFPFLVLAIAMWTRERSVLAGVFLGIAAALQVFPLFFALPVLVQGAFLLLRKRTRECRPHLRFGAALAAVLLLGFAAGSMTGRGIRAWQEWHAKIDVHRNYLRGEIFNIGLANFTDTVFSTDHRDGENYLKEIELTFQRLAALHREIAIYDVVGAGLLVLWLITVWRAPRQDLMGHGFLIFYALASASPYYYLPLALVPFFFRGAAPAMQRYALWGTASLYAVHWLLFRGSSVSLFFWPHLWSECALAIFFLGLSVASLLAGNRGNAVCAAPDAP